MAKNRSPSQSFVGLWLEEELNFYLTEHCNSLGVTKAEYIRRALGSALNKDGQQIDQKLLRSPSREGKGGRKPRPKEPDGEKTKTTPEEGLPSENGVSPS